MSPRTFSLPFGGLIWPNGGHCRTVVGAKQSGLGYTQRAIAPNDASGSAAILSNFLP